MGRLTLREVQQMHQDGRLEEARTGYLALLGENPRDVDALHMLGILCAEEDNLEAAQCYLQNALSLAQDDPSLALHLANVLKLRGLFSQAVQVLEALLAQCPQFVSAFNNLGTVYYAQEKWPEAINAFQTAIDLQPDYVDAYYNLGLALNKNKRFREAANTYGALLELAPEHPGAHFQMGCLLMQQGKIPAAVREFQGVARDHPGHFETQTNLATCYLKLGKLNEAKTAYLRSLEIHPADSQVLFNLGVIAAQQNRADEALDYYLRCVHHNPDHFAAHNNLGVAYMTAKKPELALQHFRAALRIHPDDKAIQHTIGILTRNENLNASPLEYVRNLFDSYADHYEQHLSQTLNYRVPQEFYAILKEHSLLQTIIPENAKRLSGTKIWDILDLGCGTGLCGELFTKKHRLTGVDISEKMLAIAKQKKIYDELVQSDIASFLKEKAAIADLVLAGDVIVYYGDLAALFTLIALALKPDGYLLFNAEVCQDRDYVMTESGRFAHSQAYLDALAAQNRLQIVAYRTAPIRVQNGTAVAGHLYLLKK